MLQASGVVAVQHFHLQTAMNNLSVFDYGDNSVRIVEHKSEPWFIAKDLCNVLDVRNVSQALLRLDDDEKDVILNDTPGGSQEMAVVSESGMYGLVLSSRKPEAKNFKRWVRDLLVELRKNGFVSIQPKTKIQILAELTAQMAEAEQIQMQHSALLSQHDEKIQLLESEWGCYRNSDGDYVTVIGFAKRRGIQVDKRTAQSIGRKASSLYKKQTGEKPKQMENQGYGLINIYPESLLSEVFFELGLI